MKTNFSVQQRFLQQKPVISGGLRFYLTEEQERKAELRVICLFTNGLICVMIKIESF